MNTRWKSLIMTIWLCIPLSAALTPMFRELDFPMFLRYTLHGINGIMIGIFVDRIYFPK